MANGTKFEEMAMTMIAVPRMDDGRRNRRIFLVYSVSYDIF